nr:MAG TPA: hypothetical protein [Caudoviricetes sp.]
MVNQTLLVKTSRKMHNLFTAYFLYNLLYKFLFYTSE